MIHKTTGYTLETCRATSLRRIKDGTVWFFFPQDFPTTGLAVGFTLPFVVYFLQRRRVIERRKNRRGGVE